MHVIKEIILWSTEIGFFMTFGFPLIYGFALFIWMLLQMAYEKLTGVTKWTSQKG
jgi:hypothetical protein